MKLLLLVSLCVFASANVLDQFRTNGILYDIYGEGRLIQGEVNCRPWTMDLFSYVNSLNTKDMTDYGKTILKRRLYQSFANICNSFNVSTDTTEMPESIKNSKEHLSLRFMDRFELAWNVLKFERDLKSLFLEHKLNNPFLDLIKEGELQLYTATDAMDFSHKTTIFPSKCMVAQLKLETRVCLNISEPTMIGQVYAIAHSGQFVNEHQAFVYFDVPNFVIVQGDSVKPIDINKCKVVFGTYIYCFSSISTKCDGTNLENCPLMAVRAGEDMAFIRQFGTGKIVATTMKEFPAFDNGTSLEVPAGIFTLRLSYGTTKGDAEIEEVQMLPVESQMNPIPSILGDTLPILKETPMRIHKITRKGQTYYSHKMPRPTVWDGFKDFFLHLV